MILGEYHQLLEEEFPTHAYLATDVIRHPLYKNIMRLNKVIINWSIKLFIHLIDNYFQGQIESEPRYDIAMLYLDRDVQLAPNVAPACLPQPRYLELPPGTLGTVVGWVRITERQLWRVKTFRHLGSWWPLLNLHTAQKWWQNIPNQSQWEVSTKQNCHPVHKNIIYLYFR